MMLGRTANRNPYASAALAIDFTRNQFWKAGVAYGSLATMPGYAYARTGTELVADNDGGIDSFVANSPPINGYGYHAYGALTNNTVWCRDLTQAPWSGPGVATAGFATGADGTALAASRLQCAAGADNYRRNDLVAGGFNGKALTLAVWVKSNTGGNQDFRFHVVNHNSVITPTSYSGDKTATSIWQRYVYTYNSPADAAGILHGITNPTSGAAVDVLVDFAELFDGNFPEGGPIIATAGATASIGAPAFSVSCANGNYNAIYTFEDGSTQTIATNIAAGAFNMPTFNTINQPRVKSVMLS